MADKELRKMNRGELIEIIYALQQNQRALREENEDLRRQLEDRRLRMEQAGSIAEAALSLNHVFEDAQSAAEQYLYSLQNADSTAAQILADAREKAEQLQRQTQEQCALLREQTKQDIQRQKAIFTQRVKRTQEKYPELTMLMRESTDG